MACGDPTCFPMVPAPVSGAAPFTPSPGKSFTITSGPTTEDLLYMTLPALREWRDARQVFFDHQFNGKVYPPDLIQRLATAENSLMELARQFR